MRVRLQKKSYKNSSQLIHLPISASAALKNAISASRAFSCTGAFESATAFLKNGPNQNNKNKTRNNYDNSKTPGSTHYYFCIRHLLWQINLKRPRSMKIQIYHRKNSHQILVAAGPWDPRWRRKQPPNRYSHHSSLSNSYASIDPPTAISSPPSTTSHPPTFPIFSSINTYKSGDVNTQLHGKRRRCTPFEFSPFKLYFDSTQRSAGESGNWGLSVREGGCV